MDPNAGYTNLSQVDKVIEDCTDALRLDPGYIKALNRRATARESLGGQDALYLALCGAFFLPLSGTREKRRS